MLQKQTKQIISIIGFAALLVCYTLTTYAARFNINTGNEKTGDHKYVFSYKKGSIIRDHIIISNPNSSNPITIHLAGVDSITNKLGKQVYRSSEEQQITIGKWIKFKSNDFVLEPSEKKTIDFSITVPDETTPGNYSGGIAVSDITPPASDQGTGTAFTAKISSRTIKNIYLEVPGTIASEAEVSKLNFEQKPNGRKYFTFDIFNRGNTILTFEGILTIEGGMLDKKTVSVPINISSVQGNTTLNQEILWPDSENTWGTFEAKLSLTAKEYNPITNTYKDFKTFNLQTSVQFIPTNYLLMIGGLLVFIILIISTIIIRKKNYLKHCEYYTIIEGDNLKAIAEKHKMKWEKIVKINKLSPPFELTAGNKILVKKIDEVK